MANDGGFFIAARYDQGNGWIHGYAFAIALWLHEDICSNCPQQFCMFTTHLWQWCGKEFPKGKLRNTRTLVGGVVFASYRSVISCEYEFHMHLFGELADDGGAS